MRLLYSLKKGCVIYKAKYNCPGWNIIWSWTSRCLPQWVWGPVSKEGWWHRPRRWRASGLPWHWLGLVTGAKSDILGPSGPGIRLTASTLSLRSTHPCEKLDYPARKRSRGQGGLEPGRSVDPSCIPSWMHLHD